MKKKRWILFFGVLLVVLASVFPLFCNKTFFHTTYRGIGGEEFFVPRFSYFHEECCMTMATFFSLRSKESLEKEINDYLEGFTKFRDESTYGYRKDDLFLQSYEVIDHVLYRSIHLTY